MACIKQAPGAVECYAGPRGRKGRPQAMHIMQPLLHIMQALMQAPYAGLGKTLGRKGRAQAKQAHGP